MSRVSVLIVEDDRDSAQTFSAMLTAHGHHVRTAGSAEDGLLEINREAPSAALVDLHLPLADGVEFLRRARTLDGSARFPIALMTGDYLVDDCVADELQALGVPLYFKPLWEKDILQIFDALVGRRGNCRTGGE